MRRIIFYNSQIYYPNAGPSFFFLLTFIIISAAVDYIFLNRQFPLFVSNFISKTRSIFLAISLWHFRINTKLRLKNKRNECSWYEIRNKKIKNKITALCVIRFAKLKFFSSVVWVACVADLRMNVYGFINSLAGYRYVQLIAEYISFSICPLDFFFLLESSRLSGSIGPRSKLF